MDQFRPFHLFSPAFHMRRIENFDWTLAGRRSYAAGDTSCYRVRTSLAVIMDNAELTRPELSQLELLHRISGIISSGLSLDRILQELIKITVEVSGSDACLVYLPDRASGEVVLRASQLPHDAEIGSLRIKLGEGITGWVAEHKSVVALPRNASSDGRFKTFPTLVEDSYEAFLSVPLVSGGEVIGVLNVHHKEPHEHTPLEIALLSFVGEQMGSAIALSRLEEENARLQEQHSELKQQLEDRKIIERAKGVLQQRYNLNEQEAYQRLRNESRRTRKPLRELAEAILMVENLGQNFGEPDSGE